ncbi:MAG: LemA family protein [Betaproteobacteria bacterium]|nr:LemA family protein [Betaproteobacteria bacterium]
MRKLALSLLAALTLSGCGYNEFQRLDEGVTAAWSEVVNNYQRRADLIPNLVATVKGAADFEKGTLEAVVTARASVGSLKVTPEVLNDPQAFSNFQKAQDGLSSALSRLLVVSENYPQLKATQQFSELAAQLEGAENRITVARGRYIKAVQAYNITVREFPNNLTAMVFGYKPKPNFTVENEKAISVAPKVDFGKPAEAKK